MIRPSRVFARIGYESPRGVEELHEGACARASQARRGLGRGW